MLAPNDRVKRVPFRAVRFTAGLFFSLGALGLFFAPGCGSSNGFDFSARRPTLYSVTPSAGQDGNIDPSTPQMVSPGQAISFTVTPDPGFRPSVGGTCGGSLAGTTYTTAPITADCTVLVTFAATHTITPSAGSNGSIIPSSSQTVNDGSTISFTVTPDAGYSASVGGTCGGSLAGTTYTTAQITADCTVSATFTKLPPAQHTVTPSAGANGSINPSTPQAVIDGQTIPFTVTPDVGYLASVGGTCGGSLAGTTYTTAQITADCTVSATFTKLPPATHTVTPSAGVNGSINPSTPQTVIDGQTMTFTVAPNAGFLASASGCGGSLAGTTYTTAQITADCTVLASFVAAHTVTPSPGPNGSIIPSTPQMVIEGQTLWFTVTPNTGYSASVDGTCGGSFAGTTYTTAPITADCTVSVTFTATHTVTPSPGPNGSIIPSTPQTVNDDSTIWFTVTPNTGYAARASGCGGTLAGTTYTTAPITADCTVSVTFDVERTVTPSAGPNGSISPSIPQAVINGSTTSFTVTPKQGYSASVGGTCGGSLAGTTYTTAPITADCTVSVTFVRAAASCSASDVQAAVDAAVDGDTILIPACSDTSWSSTDNPVLVDCTSRSLTIKGTGQGQTIIYNGRFDLLDLAGADGKTCRATGITLAGQGGFRVFGDSKSWRIDHIYFDHVGPKGIRAIKVIPRTPQEIIPLAGYTGYTKGLVDHCVFDNLTAIAVHISGNESGGNYEWSRPLNLGTDDAVYIEDNTFKNDSYFVDNPVTDCDAGGAFVFRHNNVTNNYSEMHDAIETNFRGCRKWEYYDNLFTNTDPSMFWNLHLRSGSGVVFNNNFTGPLSGAPIYMVLNRAQITGETPWSSLCSATSGSAYLGIFGYPETCSGGADCANIDGPSSDPDGYPCRDQIGWTGGVIQTSAPALFWNNIYNDNPTEPHNLYDQETRYYTKGTDYCSNASASMPVSCNTITTTYAPYMYPHPLATIQPEQGDPSVITGLSLKTR